MQFRFVIPQGYDQLVGASLIAVGAVIGTMASTVNPFATGVASDTAGISLGEGVGLPLLMYVVLTAVAVAYVLRYAARVKADPSKSLVGTGDAHTAVQVRVDMPMSSLGESAQRHYHSLEQGAR
jgi:uncharacterized ion transporter superfamily protein YfcC